MNSNDAENRLKDESEMRWLLERYFVAMDSKNEPLLRSCFASDCAVSYHRNEPREVRFGSREDLVRYLVGTGAWSIATIHALSSTHIHKGANGYQATTFAVAQLPVGDKVLVRGLRYDDSFVFGEQGWQIRTRDHKSLWQYDAVQAPSMVPAVKA